MKSKMTMVGVLLAMSGSVFASEKALITKVKYPGFVHPDFAVIVSCEVFLNHVSITKTFGNGDSRVVLTEAKNINIAGNIEKLISAAAADKIQETPNNLCDAPSTATMIGSEVLFSSGGCGSPQKERQGGAAYLLRSMVDGYCNP